MTTIPFPFLLERHQGQMLLQFRNNEDILGYRIRVANTLDNAYGTFNGVVGAGTTALFDVQRGRTFISKALRIKKTAIMGDITRGQTRSHFDPNEFFGLSPEVPPDSNLWFVRAQVATIPSGGFPLGFPGGAFPGTANASNQSDIFLVQPPGFASVPRPTLTLYGTAPNVGAVPGLPAPPESMVVRVPFFADTMVITNHGMTDLLCSAGKTLPMVRVPAGMNYSSGMKDEIVLAANGSNPTFSIWVTTMAGWS